MSLKKRLAQAYQQELRNYSDSSDPEDSQPSKKRAKARDFSVTDFPPIKVSSKAKQTFTNNHCEVTEALGSENLRLNEAHTDRLLKDAKDHSFKLLVNNCRSDNLAIIPRRGFIAKKHNSFAFNGNIQDCATNAQVIENDSIRQLFLAANFYQTQSVTLSTSNTYNSFHNNISKEIEHFLNVTIKASKNNRLFTVFPLDTEDKIRLVFVSLITANDVRTKYIDQQDPDSRIKYSTVRGYRAAIRHLHILNNIATPLTNPSLSLCQFFEGIKKSCSHTTQSKTPALFSHVVGYAKLAYQQIKHINNSVDKHTTNQSLTVPITTLAIIRRAAILCVGFFGVRRNSETLHLKISDVQDQKSHFVIKVRSAKNDQLALGHKTIVPHIATLIGTSPYLTLQYWIKVRKAFLKNIKKSDQEYLFINVDGGKRSKGHIISSDTLSKDIKLAVTSVDGSIDQKTQLSLRSGGSQFYCKANPGARSTARHLGG